MYLGDSSDGNHSLQEVVAWTQTAQQRPEKDKPGGNDEPKGGHNTYFPIGAVLLRWWVLLLTFSVLGVISFACSCTDSLASGTWEAEGISGRLPE